MNETNRIINGSIFDSISTKYPPKSNNSGNVESTTAHDEYVSPLEQTFSELRRKYIAAAGPQFGITEMEYSSSVSFGDVDFDDALLNQRGKGSGSGSGSGRNKMRAGRLGRRTWGWDDESEQNTAYTWGRMNLEKQRSISNTQNLASGYSRCISTADLYANNRSSTLGLGSNSLSPGKISSSSPHMKRQSSAGGPGRRLSGYQNNSIKSPLHERIQSSVTLNQSNMSSSVLSIPYLNQLEQQKTTPYIDDSNFFTSTSTSRSSHAENLLLCAPHLRHLSIISAQMQGTNHQSNRNPLSFLLGSGTSNASSTNVLSGDGGSSSGSSQITNVNSSSIAEYEICLDQEYANEIAALKLADFVKVLAHEMSAEEFADVEGEVSSQVFLLIHSSNRDERMAGVAAMDALIDIPSADEETKMIKCFRNLSISKKNADVDYSFLSGVTKCLGKIFLLSSNVDYVDCEVIKAMEWLKSERSDRRLAAVLTIKELAQNAPTAFYSKMNQSFMGQGGTDDFLKQLFPALRDPQPIVRVCAADALAVCLKIIVDPSRKHHSMTAILCQIYSFVIDGFKLHKNLKGSSNPLPQISQLQTEAAQHSSLLIVGDMLACVGSFMLPRFDEVCQCVLDMKHHEKEILRLEVVRLIPSLARRCPGSYTRRYLGKSLKYIMSCASRPPSARAGADLRPTAYFALGQLVLAVSKGHGEKGGSIPKSTLQFDDVNNDMKSSSKDGDNDEVEVVKYYMKKGDIYANLDQMFTLVQDGLKFVQSEALHCGADLVQGLGSYAEPYVANLLNDMFQSGLCEDLICCLHSIAHFLPSETTFIENRLMQELSLILAGTKAVKQLCDPLQASPKPLEEVPFRDYVMIESSSSPPSITIDMSQSEQTIMKLTLSLRTLGTLLNMNGGQDSSQGTFGWTLLPFIRDVVSCYLLHPLNDVRKEAALTCCLLLLPKSHIDKQDDWQVQSYETLDLGTSSIAMVEEVIQKLLSVAVSDASPSVRNSIIRALDDRYDSILCQGQHLPPLFLCLKDETLAVRTATLRLLGRLASFNPAAILPELRQVLMELIIELRCNGDTGGGKETATRLLIVFFKANALHRLVHPFLSSIIDALPLKGTTPRLATVALEALGELSQVVKEDLKPWLHQLLPLIIETMQDQSSANKQRTSLKTLGQISGNTKYVIDPYLDYPQLLRQAASVLPGTKRAPWMLRQQVIRTLGILGALDPDRYPSKTGSKLRKSGGIGSGYFEEKDDDKAQSPGKRVSISILNGKRDEDLKPSALQRNVESVDQKFYTSKLRDDEDAPAHLYMYELYSMTAQPISKISPANRLTPSDENFYPTVALQALTTILKDPSLSVHHGMVMQAVMYIFNSLGLRCVPFLNGIVPHILHTARTCGQVSLREALLQQVASLSGIVRENLSPYVPEIFEVVKELWENPKHFSTILILVQKIAIGVPSDFRQYVPDLVSRFLSSIDEFCAGSWMRKFGQSYGEAFERLELISKSIRILRNTLGDYMHVLLPALLKLVDSTVSPGVESDEHKRTSDLFSRLSIYTIQTIAVLLNSQENEDFIGFGSSKLTGIGTSTRNHGISLPARAAQPLIRILGKVHGNSIEIGHELVETVCVCAEYMGRERWIPLYHVAARDAILSWHHRVNIFLSTVESDVDQQQTKNDACKMFGLNIYDDIIDQMLVGGRVKRSIRPKADRTTKKLGLSDKIDESGHGLNAFSLDNVGASMEPFSNQTNKHRINQGTLLAAWDVSQCATREEWDDWMRRFALQLLREAPAPALRACAELAFAYQPLARELFSAAFASCWSELNQQYRSSLVDALKIAFEADASPEILQTLLNLAEYAERDGVQGGLPIEIDILANLALTCRSYAKALHYKELEYQSGGGISCTEDLISINKKLDLPEAALGILKSAQLEMERHGGQISYSPKDAKTRNEFSSRIFHRHQGEGLVYNVMSTYDDIAARGNSAWAGVDMQASWLAKLGSWADALAMYERNLENDPHDIEAVLGCMKCFNARGEWSQVIDLWNAFRSDSVAVKDRRKASRFCAQAAYRLGRWDDLEMYSAQLIESRYDQYMLNSNIGTPRIDFDGAFFSAIVNIHRKQWIKAAIYIDGARRAMDSRFTALMAESHKRAYSSMVTAQTLAEMEEIISFRQMEERAKASSHQHPANRNDYLQSREQLVSLWRKRLAGCRVDAEVHSSILAVRSLILGPTDEVDATLTLSALSRQAQYFLFSERVLLEPLESLGVSLNSPIFGFDVPTELNLGLLSSNSSKYRNGKGLINNIITGEVGNFFPTYGDIHEKYTNNLIAVAGDLKRIEVEHKLYYAYVKYLWSMNQSDEAMNRLTYLANIVDMIAHCNHDYGSNLRGKCWMKLGEWKIALSPPGNPLTELKQQEILMAFKRSTAFTHDGYRAWHNWALINFRLAQQNSDSRQNAMNDFKNGASINPIIYQSNSSTIHNHVATAVHGFIKAISLGTKRWSASVQQDLLNFLSCLFKYGESKEVAAVIKEEIDTVTLEAWLGVLPQLLARIQINSPIVRSILHPLLIRLGEKHPQALMYPLSVLVKSPVNERKEAAINLMNSLKKHSYTLVEDALMVSSELIRVAILWLEQWHEGLEDASRLYFGEGNVNGMLEVLIPLHEEMEKGPTTRREQDFHKSFGNELMKAHSYVKEYIRLVTRDGGVIPTQGGFMPTNQPDGLANVHQKAEAEAALNHSWDLYYTVFRKINKQLPGLTKLELSHCSPRLLQARNLELAVPGSYKIDGSYVKISQFYPTVQVITSKQRPRKIVLQGDDGKDYVYLLKGHEDLRQDERVMQLFGLVNALLARDRRTNNYDLNIQRYTITPLSHNAGVVGWVPHTDTLHSLIRDYRESKRIPLNMENREMLRLANDYDLLTVMQKIEIFSEALDRTTGRGNDLYEVLWAKSTNSEEWLERRTKFTRSLAVMSMVGYILGLGDRHPSNLMLDQISGRVLHIDFGDCFEVAMNREKFPEKIPFRLTRMLIKAMEVSGVEGSYRSTCERTMAVLRDNRDSLVAMLEAFVYDPLISWRLLSHESNGTNEQNYSTEGQLLNTDSSTSDHLSSSVKTMTDLTSVTIMENTIMENSEEGADEEGNNDFAFDANTSQKILSHYDNEKRRKSKLEMYADIQSMVANMSVDSRIASITGGKTVGSSMSRSRLGRSTRQREAMSFLTNDDDATAGEALNEKALKVIKRVQDKLTGTDFECSLTYPLDDGEREILDVQDQVQRLIVQATSTENLCQLFIGWCAFW